MKAKPCSADDEPSNKFDNAPTGEAWVLRKRVIYRVANTSLAKGIHHCEATSLSRSKYITFNS